MNYYGALLYTDPGSGTLILQLLAAALFGLLFYLRFFIRRVKGIFKRDGETTRDEQVKDALDGGARDSQALSETEGEIGRGVGRPLK